MNTKIGTTILLVACVGLAVALVIFKAQTKQQQQKATDTILDLSNQLGEANGSITDLRQTNFKLNSDLATNRETVSELSNHLAETAGTLASTAAALMGSEQQITNLNQRIADLEAQNQSLDQRADSLSNTIASLNTQITLTQIKLVTSQTNNAFLEAELKRQVAQREELERKFNDLKVVRAQVAKLRTDLLVARRLEWIREGIDPTKMPKGGQLLMARSPLPAAGAAATRSNNFNLNVEVSSDGSVHVIPPLTNSPAATNSSP